MAISMSDSNLTNSTSRISNTTIKGDVSNVLSVHDTSLLITIIFNSITCPFTVLLNVLVIMAVKKRPRLQTTTNILLACLAVTDASTGLIVQPSFILWKTLQLLCMVNGDTVKLFHNSLLRVTSICSLLHLMLVTGERLIAIRVTMHYPYIVTTRNIKVAVIACWLFSISYVACGLIFRNKVFRSILNLLAALIVISSVLFIASAYGILYRETRRHRKMIKTQQLPPEEVQRFAKESKALKTTVLVVGAVILCFTPIAFIFLLSFVLKQYLNIGASPSLWVVRLPC